MINSRALGLLLAICIATITTAFLSLLSSISNVALTVAFGLSFSSSYILVRLVLDFLFFREINSIYEELDKIKNQDLSHLSKHQGSSINPLAQVNREIKSYLQSNQLEIAELKRMEAFRREFIADVSHELKTPIFAAQGFVHTLLDGAVEDKKVRNKFLKKAAKSLDGLDILVQDLLTISQMETGEIRMRLEHFNIIEMVKDIVDQAEEKAEKREISLIVDDGLEDLYVNADYQRIYQVLTNLIINGIKYTNKGGSVKISFEQEADNITTYIEDNGKGIPKEDINRIFERFYRVEKSRSKEKGGTGLGLSIVKHIMEGHQSRIEVESKEGEGSKFWFKLRSGKKPAGENWAEHDIDD